MRLHVVGNGCPAPSAEWFGSSFILETGTELVMIDCGPATTYKMARMGLAATAVGHLFFTHHHFDHNADFPCFVLTRWDQSTGKEPAFTVYGPPPTQAFVDALVGEQGAFQADLISRVRHPVSQEIHRRRGGDLPRPGLAIAVRELSSGATVQGEGWAATASWVHHVQPWLVSFAYRFDTDDGSVVFAGDCADCPELRELVRGADTLVIGCPLIGRSDYNTVLSEVITGTTEVAAIANDTGVARVILTHVTPGFSKPGTRDRALAEVAQHYDGEVLLPAELTTVELRA